MTILEKQRVYIQSQVHINYPTNFRPKKMVLLGASLVSGLLLALSFPDKSITPLIFFALAPMLFIEDYIFHNQKEQRGKFGKFSVFFYTYIGFLLWNFISCYWICYSTLGGGIFASLFNSFLMAGVFQLYHFSRSKLFNKGLHSFLLVFYWLAFEYFHLNWDLSWPWLNLGNCFATTPQWIQWYSLTGCLGELYGY